MIIVRNKEQLSSAMTGIQGCAVAIGKFDGLHLGHQALLQEILKKKEEGLTTAILTFDPSPEVYFGIASEGELSTPEEKRKTFERLGIDILYEFPFTKRSAATPPEDFIRDVLADGMHAAFVAAGEDLSFGDHGKGDFALLDSLKKKFGYSTRMISKVSYKERPISSTRIRSYLKQGRMEEAAACLGAPYSFTGLVEHGKALGRTINIPTANIVPEPGKLLPPLGVYYSLVRAGENTFYGMTNIGRKPTVKEDNIINLETYLYDFQEEIYGREITVELLHFKRPEIKFADVDALKRQMQEDVNAGREYFMASKVSKLSKGRFI